MSINTNDPLCGKVEIRKPIRFFIPVRVEKGEYKDGVVRLLAELIESLPTNKELRESGKSSAERREVVMGALRKLADRKGKDNGEKILIRRDLEVYRNCFSRLDCDDTGIELRVLHQDDGGPSDLEFGAILRELIYVLGAKKVEITRFDSKKERQEVVGRIEMVNEAITANMFASKFI